MGALVVGPRLGVLCVGKVVAICSGAVCATTSEVCNQRWQGCGQQRRRGGPGGAVCQEAPRPPSPPHCAMSHNLKHSCNSNRVQPSKRGDQLLSCVPSLQFSRLDSDSTNVIIKITMKVDLRVPRLGLSTEAHGGRAAAQPRSRSVH